MGLRGDQGTMGRTGLRGKSIIGKTDATVPVGPQGVAGDLGATGPKGKSWRKSRKGRCWSQITNVTKKIKERIART